MEVSDLFTLLESNQPLTVEEAKKKFHELFSSCNQSEAWLVNGLFDYYVQTGSLRIVEILVGIREPQDVHLFNKFSECLRSNNKVHGLTLLGHIVRRQPTWLFKITRHPLFKELLKLLKTETEIIPLMSALLVINIILPMVAGLMEQYLQDLFQIFSHLAVWDTINPNKLPECHLLHLQMALYALFLRLYGMYPCNFLSYLRQEYSQAHKTPIFTHTIKPMLDNVKIHPLLVTASKDSEVTPIRWRKMEPHDVVVECAKYAIGTEVDRLRDNGSPHASIDITYILDGKYLNRSTTGEKDVWSPISYCGMSTPPESAPTSIPHTPIAQTHIVSATFPQQEGTSPPEAAVEATPETTPIKDIRHVVRGPPSNSSIPRALNTISSSPIHSHPSSPMKKEASPFSFPSNSETSAFHQPIQEKRRDSLISQKMQRIVTDRVQLSSDNTENQRFKPKGLLQPTSPLRIINGPGWGSESPADQEDREVEITMTSDSNSPAWHPRQTDSVVQDIIFNDHDEIEECQQESCTAGGICMPNSNSMRDFTLAVKNRLRYYSQCHGDPPHPGLSTESSPSDGYNIPMNPKVRRANSCPEMKKTSSSLERHPVEKVDEEPSSINGHIMDGPSDCKAMKSISTQTDNPLPYEHLFLAVFPAVDQSHYSQASDSTSVHDTGNHPSLPQNRVSPSREDLYMNKSLFYDKMAKLQNKDSVFVGLDNELQASKEQVLLMAIHLNFEKHHREMHAERNRRLLGKSRKVRSQEELTSALKDQVSLLQTDKELLHSDLHKRADEAKANAQQLHETVTHYQNQNSILQAEYAKIKVLKESLEEQLKQEREKTLNVTKELNQTKTSLLSATNELSQAASMAEEGRELKECITGLQRELIVGGEVAERYRQRINSLIRYAQQADQGSVVQQAFSNQVSVLNQALESQTAAIEAMKFRVGELDTLVMKRDSTIVETKRLLQEAKDEYHVQLEAIESKYNSLRAVNSRLEGELLELRHQINVSHASTPTLPKPPSCSTSPFINLQVLTDTSHGNDIHLPSLDHNCCTNTSMSELNEDILKRSKMVFKMEVRIY